MGTVTMRMSLIMYVFLAITTVMVHSKTFLIKTQSDENDKKDYQLDGRENSNIFAPCILGRTTYQHGDRMPSIEGQCCNNCECFNGTKSMCKEMACNCEMEMGLKSSKNKEELIKQKKVVGCGGGITMRCNGGSLKIHSILYSCQVKAGPNADQLNTVKALCEKKEECTLTASRKVFGKKECSGSSDNEMVLHIMYSCDGEKDGTYLTGPSTCTAGDSRTKIKNKEPEVEVPEYHEEIDAAVEKAIKHKNNQLEASVKPSATPNILEEPDNSIDGLRSILQVSNLRNQSEINKASIDPQEINLEGFQ